MRQAFGRDIIVFSLILICCWTTAFAQTREKPSIQDTASWYATSSVGIISSFTNNQRTIGIPPEYATKYGNLPFYSVGISLVSIGNFLFNSKHLRHQMTFEKLFNTYPTTKLLENTALTSQFGYNVIETATLNVYPFLGGRSATFYIDTLVRLWVVSAEVGIGVEYIIPKTPFRLGIQAGYSHSFNMYAAPEVLGNQSGCVLRTYLTLWLRNHYSQWEL